MPSLIVDLSQHLLGRTVGSFLDLKSAGRLDSALCIRDGRDGYLSMLASHELSFSTHGISDMGSCLRWILLRNTKLNILGGWRPKPELDIQELVAIFQNSANSLREVHYCDNLILSALSSISEALTKLHYVRIIPGFLECNEFTGFMRKVACTLLSLDINGEVPRADRQLTYFSVPCPQVQVLCLGANFRSANVEGLENCFPSLQDIEIADQCASTLWAKLRHFPHLRKLSLTNMEELTDLMIDAVAFSCPWLTYVEIWHCVALTDAAVVSVSQHCTQLETLTIGYLEGALSMDAGASIGEHLSNSLTSLSIFQCGDTTGAALSGLARCKHLKYLDITGMESMFPGDLCSLFTSCMALSEVVIERVEIDDKVLVTIANHCAELDTLSIAGCGGFTEIGILKLTAQARRLTHLTVADNDPLLNVLSIALLKEKYPTLKISVTTIVVDGEHDEQFI